MRINVFDSSPIGYSYLMEKFAFTGMPNWHRSSVLAKGTHSLIDKDGIVDEFFRSPYWPGERVGDHLAFALKYDGVNLGLLSKIFEYAAQDDIIEYIQSKPTGKYARRIWFFYEFLTGKRLPLDDITSGNYVDVLDVKQYYTVANGEKSTRHRVFNNLLGPESFCPIIRKTKKLSKMDAFDLREKCENILTTWSPSLLRRALGYLYNRETKSSFAIENIKPDASRIEKFVTLLTLAEKEDFCEKNRLIELQNMIVDARFQDSDYRLTQNYVGQRIGYQNELVHYISPKPDDLPGLMDGLIASHKRMKTGNVSPIIHAAVIAYGFVFLHPFEDGNGRIHRFLIHNILSIQKGIPTGLMFPVSAVMLKNPVDYDGSLEAFSSLLLPFVRYRLDGVGKMTVTDDTAHWYRYMDMTAQAEALYHFIAKTIEEELVEELTFLANYDKTKKALQNIIDMPDRLIDLFMQLCLQNSGKLSPKKRSTYFHFLTEEELAAMLEVVKERGNVSPSQKKGG